MTSSDPLKSFLLPERLERLEDVLSSRTVSVTAVLENMHKDHNISAILRTCECFGIQRVHVVPQPGEGRVFNTVTQGCDRWLTIRRYDRVADCLARLKAEGYRVFSGVLGEDSVDLEKVDFSGRIALVFSNELDGLSREAADMVDGSFLIPMAGFSQSLNVSVAAGIAINRVMQYKRSIGETLEPLSPAEAREIMDRWIRMAVKHADRILDGIRRRK